MSDTGRLVIVSAPSGAGKGSIIAKAMENDPTLIYSISATTREPRAGERNGQDYIFLSEPEFRGWIDEGKFVEWAEVHGHLYGTPRDSLADLMATHHDVILEVDVQGMRQVRKAALDNVLSVFIMPPSIEELERRLRDRGGLSDEQLALRLANARAEMVAKDEFDHVVINDDLDAAVQKVEMILRKTRS